MAVQKHGIDRLRTKGGASAEALYELENARLDTAGGIGPRAGCAVDNDQLAGTVGLYGFKGKKHVFSSVPVTVADPTYEVVILRHPSDSARTVVRIHYVYPLLGRLYIVAEFDNGDIFDFWLQLPGAWAPSTVYQFGASVQPIIPNGYVYEITNASVLPAWAPNTTYVLNDEVLPTVANGFKYKAIAVAGSPIRSSSVEPTWPTTEGGTVVEARSG